MKPDQIMNYIAFHYQEFMQGIHECDREFTKSYETDEQDAAYELGRQLGRSYFEGSEVV